MGYELLRPYLRFCALKKARLELFVWSLGSRFSPFPSTRFKVVASPPAALMNTAAGVSEFARA